MNILVIGRGWTGKKVYNECLNRGHSAKILSHNISEIRYDMARNEYDYVINCAGVTGYPNVDACESDKANTLEGNAIFPIRLSELCKEYNVRMMHFSSGCIYQGNVDDIYAPPNYFGSIYSISKGISDSYLLSKAVVLRIRMPFTGKDEQKNYLSKVYKYAANGRLIDGGQNSLTDLDEAVRVSVDLVETGAINGPYNLVNQGSVNMHELADMMGIENPNWFTPEEFRAATVADRSTCVIRASTLMRPVKDALKDAIESMKNAK